MARSREQPRNVFFAIETWWSSAITTGKEVGTRDLGAWIRELSPLREAPNHLTATVERRGRHASEARGPAEHEIGGHVRGAFVFGVRGQRGEDTAGFVGRLDRTLLEMSEATQL